MTAGAWEAALVGLDGVRTSAADAVLPANFVTPHWAGCIPSTKAAVPLDFAELSENDGIPIRVQHFNDNLPIIEGTLGVTGGGANWGIGWLVANEGKFLRDRESLAPGRW